MRSLLLVLSAAIGVAFGAGPTKAPDLANIPIPFEPNHGQFDGAHYVARAPGVSLYIRGNGATLILPAANGTHDLSMTLLRSREPEAIRGRQPLPGISSYFNGPDQTKWIRGVPHFSQVHLATVYAGIDLVYYGSGSRLEYDFQLAPGADPKDIAFSIEGASQLRLHNGNLVMKTPAGDIVQHKPVAYQLHRGKRLRVDAGFVVKGREVRFQIGRYRKDLPLTIDPTIQWTTVNPQVTGFINSASRGIAIGPDGSTYVTGYQFLNTGVGAFLFKVNPSGTAITYSTTIAGAYPGGIAVDATGAAYVAGSALSNLPVKNAIRPVSSAAGSPSGEAFLAKVNTSGSDLVYCTFIGGSLGESVSAITVDAAGSPIIAGATTSADFHSVNSLQPFFTLPGSQQSLNGFVAKLRPDAQSFVYSTFFGGGANVTISGLSLDRNGKTLVTGTVTAFPGSGNTLPLLNALNQLTQGSFFSRLSDTGQLEFSSYLPHTVASGIATDSLNNSYYGAFDGSDFVVAQIRPDARSLAVIARMQGPLATMPNTVSNPPVIAIGQNDLLHIIGTSGPNLPQVRPMTVLGAGKIGAFVAKLTTTGSVLYSTFVTTNLTYGLGIAVDLTGAAVICGTSTAGVGASAGIPPINPVVTSVPNPTLSYIALAFAAKIVDTSDTTLPLVSVTFKATAPLANPGLEVAVDGTKVAVPATLQWLRGTAHEISVSFNQGSNGLSFQFKSWSDGGAATHAIAPTSDATYTADFDALIAVRTGVQPVGAGTVSISPAPQNGFLPLNTNITVSATPSPGAAFQRWVGILAGQPNPANYVLVYNPQNGNATAVFTADFGGGSLGFVTTTPCRVLDTRLAGNAFLPGGATRDVFIPQSSCGIPTTAKAYALNITVVPLRPLAYLTVYPTGQARPLVSTLNAFEGQTVANAAIVPAGASGGITLFATDDTHVIIDINGYFADNAEAMSFYPLNPCRVVDTRTTPPFMTGGSVRTFTIAGNCGVPASARAFVLNFTVVPKGPLAYISTWPAGSPQPLVSTLNSFQGRVLANAAIVPAGAGGAINVYASDNTDVVADVSGYFAPVGGGGALRFYPMTPCRLADTRSFGAPRLAGTYFFSMSVPGCSTPDTAVAFSLNATAIPSGYLGYITLYRPGGSVPLASTLNAWQGQIVANAAIVPGLTSSGFGYVSAYLSDPTHLILDINGYFAP